MKGKTILVLEDELALLQAVQKKLEKNGATIISARSVKGALKYLESKIKIDAIWLDHYLLGQENGLDFVGKIKQTNSQWKTVPIFVVSNTASPDKINTYLKFGVNKYYTKSDHRLENIINDIKNSLK